MLDALLLGASVLLASAAQILQKRGMAQVVTAPRLIWLRPFMQPMVLAGLACHIALTLLWLVVLTRVEVSLAFPVLSLSFAVVITYSGLVLGEHIAWERWAGVALIIFGVCLLAYGR